MWSAGNVAKVTELTERGLMHPSGLLAFESRRTDRASSYRRSAAHWVISAKRPETRKRRLAQLITDSAAGRPVPPLTRR